MASIDAEFAGYHEGGGGIPWIKTQPKMTKA
jgi:hypothetical protein